MTTMTVPSYKAINLDNPTVMKIIRTAGGCFGRRGYRGTSLMDIARATGLSKSLLHYHFASKAHLFLEVELQLFRELLVQVRRVTAAAPQGIAGFDQALEEVMDFLERELEHVCLLLEFRTVAVEQPRVAEQLEDFNQEILALVEEGLHNVLGPMVDRLVIPADRVARLILTTFNGLIVNLAFTSAEGSRDEIRETFADVKTLFLNSIFTKLT